MSKASPYDVSKLRNELIARGWLPRDLARAAKVSDKTVSRVLAGDRMNPRTWKKLVVDGLRQELEQYVIREGTAA